MSGALYSPPPVGVAPLHTISPWSREAIGVELGAINTGAVASGTGTVADLVTYVPFRLGKAFTVVEVGWLNGTIVGNGDAQVGVYDAAAAEVVECAATTTVGASSLQTINVTDTALIPGTYYMAFRAHNATDRFFRVVPAAGLLEAFGVLQQTGQTDLPATATFAVNATAFLPVFYLAGHTLL